MIKNLWRDTSLCLNRIDKLFLILICLFSTIELNAQIRIKGIILDSVTEERVPFASILLLHKDDLIAGTVASKDGKFYFDVDDSLSNTEIVVSAIGYYEYIGTLRDFDTLNDIIITLREQNYVLPDIVVNNRKSKIKIIGHPDIKIEDANRIRGAMATRKHGLETGIHFLPNTHDVGKTIDSVKFYVSPHGSVNAELLLRIQGFLHDNRESLRSINIGNICKDSCYDIISKGIRATINGAGWYNIDLTGYNVVVPHSGLFLSHITTTCRDKVKWEIKGNSYGYGVYIPPYQEQYPDKFSYIVMNKGRILVFKNRPYMVPMFVIYLS